MSFMGWVLLIVALIIGFFVYRWWQERHNPVEKEVTISDSPPTTDYSPAAQPEYGGEPPKGWIGEPTPVHKPEEIEPAPNAVINPDVDRVEAEKEVLEEPAPLSEKTFVTEPMVQPVDDPSAIQPEEKEEVVADATFPAFGSQAEAEQVEKKGFAGTPFTGKFSDDEVRAIRASTDSVDILAVKYDASKTTIKRIRRRETYKHVAD
jgi:hypothetical protein